MSTSVNNEIITALSPIGYAVDYITHKSNAEIYITFNFEGEFPEMFADDDPQYVLIPLQVHFFCPRTFDHLEKKIEIINALVSHGWSFPTVYTMYEDDTDKMHLTFTTEKELYING